MKSGRQNNEYYFLNLLSYSQNLPSIPKEYWQDLEFCRKAVIKSSKALGYVLKEELNAHDYVDLCLSSVTAHADSIEFVPETVLLEHPEMAMTAVTNSATSLEYISEEVQKKHPEIYESAIKNNVIALKYVAPSILEENPTIFLDAVKQNADAKNYVPQFVIEKHPQLYKEIFIEALRSQKTALKWLNKGNLKKNFDLYKEIAIEAAERGILPLQYLPPELQIDDVYIAGLRYDISSLREIPADKLNKTLYLAAVMQDSLALGFIEDEMLKKEIIDIITPEKILSSNYAARKYFPNEFDYKTRCKEFLSEIKYAVITGHDKDHEINDFYLVYSTSPKRAGKTICTGYEDAKDLLKDLREIPEIHLTLMGHAMKRAEEIAALTVKDITDILEENTNINRVNLLGCKTARAKKFDKEKEIILSFKPDESKCGLILASNLDNYTKYLNEKFDQIYFIVRTDNSLYKLVHVYKEDNSIKEKEYELNQDDMNSLQNRFNRNKPFKFPSKKDEVFVKKNDRNPLNEKELQVILRVRDKVDKYDKQHPKYKKHKQMYPFFGGITIDETEAVEKLTESLLQKVVTAIKNDDNIRRPVSVKGYVKSLHVDTKERRKYSTHTYLYSSTYKSSTFHTKKENIDRKKLKQERNRSEKKLREHHVRGKTTVKSVKVTLKK